MTSLTSARVQDLLVRMDSLDSVDPPGDVLVVLKDVRACLETLKEVLDHPLKPPAKWPFWLEPFQLVHQIETPGGHETPKGRRTTLTRSLHAFGSPTTGSKPRRVESSTSLMEGEGSWRDPPKRPKPTKSEHDAAVGAFRTAFNKLSKPNFETISASLVSMQMPTKAAFDEAVTMVFDKALKDRFFQRLYARLACVLGKKQGGWCEVVFDERPDGSVWWAYPQDPQESGVDGDDAESKDPEFHGPFKSRADAEAEAFKTIDFRRALLGHCQQSFTAGSAPNRQDYFSTITFIGELFVEGLAPLAIIYICLQALMDTPPSGVEEDQVEAFCALLTTVGAVFQGPDAEGKGMLPSCLDALTHWSKSKALAGRIRFGCMDVLDLAAANWVPKATLAAKSCVS